MCPLAASQCSAEDRHFLMNSVPILGSFIMHSELWDLPVDGFPEELQRTISSRLYWPDTIVTTIQQATTLYA